MSTMDSGGNGRTIELTYGTFGKVYALVEGGITLDTYCSWNGDPRPRWMDEVAVQSGRPQTLSERHQAHYQSCNCLADSAVCCDPACPCKQTDPVPQPPREPRMSADQQAQGGNDRPLEWCRACRDLGLGDPLPASFIVWGKFFPPESLGPRCSMHLDSSIRINQVDQYAVFDLRGLERTDLGRIGRTAELDRIAEKLAEQKADGTVRRVDLGGES